MIKKNPIESFTGEGAPPPSAFSLADFMTALPVKQETLAAAPKEQDFPSLAASKTPAESSAPAGTAWACPPSHSQVKSDPEEPVTATATPLSSANAACPVPTSASAAYSIGKTKKGGLPVRVESRSKGKKVTVVFNVTG